MGFKAFELLARISRVSQPAGCKKACNALHAQEKKIYNQQEPSTPTCASQVPGCRFGLRNMTVLLLLQIEAPSLGYPK